MTMTVSLRTLALALALALLVTRTLQTYPSEQMQKWHDAVHERLFRRNQLGKLASFPFCAAHNHNSNDTDTDTVNYLGNFSTPLHVTFDVDVSQVLEVNERQRVLTLKLLVTLCWVDCRLTWSLQEFPVTQVHLSNHYFRKLDLFVPHITMLEELEQVQPQHVEYIAEIWSNHIALSKRYTTAVSCNVDVSMYPLDVQVCNLTFESILERSMVTLRFGEWTHFQAVRARPLEGLRASLGRYMPNDAWEVRVLPGHAYTQNSCLEYESEAESYCMLTDTVTQTLLLRRHPTYQLVSLMLPAFLIVIISGCVFLIPPGSSDKMGLSLSSMLSLFIFTNLMYDKMPESGDTLPLLSQYFLSSVALVGLSCVASSMSAIFAQSKRSSKLLPTMARKRRRQPAEASSTQAPDPDAAPVEIRQLAKMFDRVFFVFHVLASVLILVIYVVRGYIPWKHYGYRIDATV